MTASIFTPSSTRLRTLMAATLMGTAALLAACGDSDSGEGKVLATVNGSDIRESKVNEQLSQLPPQLVQGREAEIRRQLVDRLIEQELIEQAVEKENIASSDEYKKQLEQAKRQIEANLLIQKKVDSTLTPQVLQQAYEQTKAARTFPAVKARHILVATEAEANALIAVATPSNFAQLAQEKSIGPSKDNGGELGWFRREAMVPEFAAVAFSTPAGQVARTPVKTQFGWHVILVEDKNDKYVPPFEQVAQALKQELSQQVVQGYLQELRSTAKVEYSADVQPAAGPESQPAQAQ
jgi:peptidyl-prolyl cis-trans isomerase C